MKQSTKNPMIKQKKFGTMEEKDISRKRKSLIMKGEIGSLSPAQRASVYKLNQSKRGAQTRSSDPKSSSSYSEGTPY